MCRQRIGYFKVQGFFICHILHRDIAEYIAEVNTRRQHEQQGKQNLKIFASCNMRLFRHHLTECL